MKKIKVMTVVQTTAGALATIVFLVMALKMNNCWALLLVGSFALVCFKPASTSMWFRSFGVKNTGRKVKMPPSDG